MSVHNVPEDREKDTRRILDDCGAIAIENLAEEWRQSGWTGPSSARQGS